MKEKFSKKEVIGVIALIIIQTIVFIIAGMNKQYIHMDEAYSLGLASYDKVEIQANEDFYNEWHNKEYYEDYLTVNDDEVNQYSQVYENQKNDVHPPLYYLILRFAMGFHLNSYSKWPGIIVNIIIYAFIAVFTYLIVKKLFEGKKNANKKALGITLLASLTLASLASVLYIRMYALATLNIVIVTYLHMLLLDSDKSNYKLLFFIGISALIGSLTHYHYLFYLAMLFIMFSIKYIKEKRYKELISYIVTMCIAGVISLLIFPYSIQHMFFGYRGQGAISNLTNISKFVSNIGIYIGIINVHVFNNLLFIAIILIIGIIICKKRNKLKIIEENSKYTKYIAFPTLFYFVLVAISSPWLELRYVMPICGMIFILAIYFVVELLRNVVEESNLDKVIIGIAIILLIMPIISNSIIGRITNKFVLEPETMYSSKKDIVERMKNESDVPTLFIFNSGCNRFLDDILLFSIVNESYVAKDIECTEENILNIMDGKDLSKGIFVFINEDQNNDEILTNIHNALELESTEWIERLNACDVYYMK